MATMRMQDPVYGAIVFDGDASISGLFGSHPQDPAAGKFSILGASGRLPGLLVDKVRNDWTQVVRSREFQRLHFLRQMGLAWLVFPSAAHTRFAHSVGTYALGELALARARVAFKNDAGHFITEPLWQWVKRYDLDEEFLAALLLHDLGHFPYSHLLEQTYGDVICHEDLGVALLMFDQLPSNSPFKKAYVTYLNECGLDALDTSTTKFAPLISHVFSKMKRISRYVIAWLIGGFKKESLPFLGVDEDWILRGVEKDRGNFHSAELKELKVLKSLVSGLLDLDRFDHYQRDSFFSGIKIANFNFNIFVNGVTIEAPETNADNPKIHMTPEAAAQAVSMLQGKETLSRYLFNDSHAVACKHMFVEAVSTHFDSIKDSIKKEHERLQWLFLTDDDITHLLKRSPSESTRALVDMVTRGQPYELIAEITDGANLSTDNLSKMILNGILIPELFGNTPPLLWAVPPVNATKPDLEKWLDLNKIYVGTKLYKDFDSHTCSFLCNMPKSNDRLRLFVHPHLDCQVRNKIIDAARKLHFHILDGQRGSRHERPSPDPDLINTLKRRST